MNIRSTATQWYYEHYGMKSKYFRSSKYYEALESWSRTPVWWFQIPQRWLEEKLEQHVVLIGEKTPADNDFHVLKVPIYYLLENFKGFTIVNDNTINLMLSAEDHNKFSDIRGKGHIPFFKFLQEEK